MSLDHVLLGALREPASGYELKQRFDTVFRHFWPAEQSQIYRTLQRLESAGWVAGRQAASARGPRRRVYSTTARGLAQLRRWLAQGPIVGDDRHAFVAQVLFLHELDDAAAARDFLAALHSEFAARLAELEAVEARWRTDDPRCPDGLAGADFYAHLTLTLGLAKYRAIAEWAARERGRAEARLPTRGARARTR